MIGRVDAHYEPPGVAGSSLSEEFTPSFVQRLLRLPVSPAFWRGCTRLSFPAILLPLAVLALAANLLLGMVSVPRLKQSAYAAATYYDEHADPLLYQDGHFRLDGERIFYWTDENVALLIDPERTIDDGEVTAAQYLVVRAEEVVLKQTGQAAEVYAVEDLEEILGVLGPGRVLDGSRIREWADRFVPPVVLTYFAVFGTLGELIGCLVYAAIAGILLMLLRGQWLGLDLAACYRVALGTSGAKIALGLLLGILGTGTGLPTFLLWPAVMLALGLLALGRSRSQPGDPASAP